MATAQIGIQEFSLTSTYYSYTVYTNSVIGSDRCPKHHSPRAAAGCAGAIEESTVHFRQAPPLRPPAESANPRWAEVALAYIFEVRVYLSIPNAG